MKFLISRCQKFNVPEEVLERILSETNKETTEEIHNLLNKSIKRIKPESYGSNGTLLSLIINYNKMQGNFKENNRIYRSISIHFRKEPEVAERCLHFIQN